MVDKKVFFHLLRAIAIIFLKIIMAAGGIVLLDVIGLGLYGFLTGINAFGMLYLVLVIESFLLMFSAFMGTTVVQQSRGGRVRKGVPWREYVRVATEEIKRSRHEQVRFWIQAGIVGLILFFVALLLPSM